MPRSATGDGGRSCLLIEPCRRDGPVRVAWCPGCRCVPVSTVFLRRPGLVHCDRRRRGPVVVAGAGKTFSGACADLFILARDGRHTVWRAFRSVVSPSFGLTRPMRPRFGMSNRRPSSLRFASISRPQRPCSAFFPWSLRAHSSNPPGLALMYTADVPNGNVVRLPVRASRSPRSAGELARLALSPSAARPPNSVAALTKKSGNGCGLSRRVTYSPRNGRPSALQILRELLSDVLEVTEGAGEMLA
jgi:hypothetical protein